MIIMPVAEDDPIKGLVVKTQGFQVRQQGVAAAGIKQPASGRRLQQARETVLSVCGYRPANRIFTDNIKLHRHIANGLSSNQG